jgi:CheY-like chemotaxis protein
MKDELFSLRILAISEAAPERESLRQAALRSSVPVEFVEVERAGDSLAGCEALRDAAFDVVFLDSRMPKPERQTVLDAARAAKGNPLVILVGAADMKTREVIIDGIAIDGALAKPIEAQEVRDLIDNCVRARLVSTALIVDDSSTVRSVIRKVLQASRFRVDATEVPDGETAIERARTQRFDIVFLDCHMPGVDGFAVLDEFKRVQPDTKVVMITGTRDVRIEDRARASGILDFLYKPFYARDIDAVLNRLFGLMPARRT